MFFLAPASSPSALVQKPWFEAVALAAGVDRVTTINFEVIATDHPQLETLTVNEARLRRDTYDLAISICSVNHDGLGRCAPVHTIPHALCSSNGTDIAHCRFGDPLDPAGDLRAVSELFDLLKPGGLLFLAVPIGHDTLVWNAHRIYGRVRLPLLFKGWEQVSSVGFDEADFDRPVGRKHAAPAVFVLRRPRVGKARHAAAPPTEPLNAPLRAETRKSLKGASAPNSTWALGVAAAGLSTCPDGQRNAEQHECLAALHEAVGAASVMGFKVVNDGEEAGVPHGCSYSRKSSNALFNLNTAGTTRDTMYPLVCKSVLVSTWALDVVSAGLSTCPEGQRNAEQDECLAALQEAVGAANVTGFKVVNDGEASPVPHGCSYSRGSSNALFNANTADTIHDILYPLVCITRV